MVFTYNAHGIAQRPYRSFSYKNQSIMAVAHRLLRDVPADGERVISQHVEARRGGQPVPGLLADGSIDLVAILTAPVETPRWDDQFQGVEEAMRRGWRVNVASLDFRAVTAITLGAMLGLSLFVLAVLPPRQSRTPETDSLEFALITLLIVIFSPLSFNYAFVWLIYPLTVALHLVLNEPSTGRWRLIERTWLVSVFMLPATAVVAPLSAQAYGNLFVPALLLLFGLGSRLHAMQPEATRRAHTFPAPAPHRLTSPEPSSDR
jgi:hypothetical protein